jgi:hypothetical protein
MKNEIIERTKSAIRPEAKVDEIDRDIIASRIAEGAMRTHHARALRAKQEREQEAKEKAENDRLLDRLFEVNE